MRVCIHMSTSFSSYPSAPPPHRHKVGPCMRDDNDIIRQLKLLSQCLSLRVIFLLHRKTKYSYFCFRSIKKQASSDSSLNNVFFLLPFLLSLQTRMRSEHTGQCGLVDLTCCSNYKHNIFCREMSL